MVDAAAVECDAVAVIRAARAMLVAVHTAMWWTVPAMVPGGQWGQVGLHNGL